jgi:hypothetical protein
MVAPPTFTLDKCQRVPKAVHHVRQRSVDVTEDALLRVGVLRVDVVSTTGDAASQHQQQPQD